jgi:hypothetical protein
MVYASDLATKVARMTEDRERTCFADEVETPEFRIRVSIVFKNNCPDGQPKQKEEK